MKLALAISGLVFLATSGFAEASPITVNFSGSKESQGIGGDSIEGSFTFDLSKATIVQQSQFQALYATEVADYQFTTGAISVQASAPLMVLINDAAAASDFEEFQITTVTPGQILAEPLLRLTLTQQVGGPFNLTTTGAPTFLNIADWSDNIIVANTDTDPEQLIGQYSVASVGVDEPGSLSVLAVGLLTLSGLSLIRRKAAVDGRNENAMAC